MASPPLRPKPDEADLWRRAMRGVAPLQQRHRARGPHTTHLLPRFEPTITGEGVGRVGRNRAQEGADIRSNAMLPASAIRGDLPPSPDFAGIDRRTAERLRRGHYPIEARLDLHGMTQDEAHRTLSSFIAGGRAAGTRCVLVITGHGRVGGGVLKTHLPRWLAEPALRRDILALAPARPQHGGIGAFYVLLRRDRPRSPR